MADTSLDDEDLISSLPDEIIITHILSLVPTKAAVATSVLSKRWNQLWISVPNLDFGKNIFHKARYEKFVDRVLSLNTKVCVRKIRLHYYGNLESSRFNAWISSIVKRDPEALDLKFSTYPSYCVPYSFCNTRNLVELKLGNWFCKTPPLVKFPNLKTIHLRSVCFANRNSMKNLLSGCPVLNNLYIDISWYNNARAIDICSSTLHVLHLRSFHHSGSKFVVDTPNLKVLDFVERNGVSYNMINISSVEKLHLGLDRNDVNPFGLLTNLPMFHNLIHLTINITDKGQWECIPGLFHHAPDLVTFVLLLGNFIVPCAWCDPNEVPRCFLSCLENVEISVCLEDHIQAEIMMIKYVLKNTNVLKKLSIHYVWADPVEEKFFIKTLVNLPRSSIACQVYFQGVVI